ncbi:hypothetical protein IscW_ISCW019295 [Ixodes scapularis]|uniref:Zinc transporter ZIP4 N-terminal domain-containing protein n=1 Tax=Ixodes scapularis TaxID=6945 RepID=B7PWR2_IXOSC|nr:hypothetical protein IscW_ISCW019295 [Ixodes scapularis]|eukprot:XP_002410209.1 hypothetical protein IscW_ISCW019295 [Ixodes scapularis]
MAKRTRLAPLLLAAAAASGLLQQCTADRTQENIDAFAKSIQNKIHCTPTGLSAYDCIECLSAQNVLRNVPWENKNTSRHPSVRELEQLSVVVLHRLSNMMKACTTESDCSSYQQCLSSLLKRVTPRSKPPQLLLRFEDMLRHIKGIYMADSPIKCFTAEEILAEVGPFESTPEVFVEKLSFEVVKNLLNAMMDIAMKEAKVGRIPNTTIIITTIITSMIIKMNLDMNMNTITNMKGHTNMIMNSATNTTAHGKVITSRNINQELAMATNKNMIMITVTITYPHIPPMTTHVTINSILVTIIPTVMTMTMITTTTITRIMTTNRRTNR